MAQLLADKAIEASSLKSIGTNTPIGQDSFIEDTVSKAIQVEFSNSRKIGIGEVAFIEAGFTKSSVFKDGGSKIDIIKANLSKNSIGEISPWQCSSPGGIAAFA